MKSIKTSATEIEEAKSEAADREAYEPRDGEEGGLVAGEEVAGVEDDLRELEQEEGDVGRAGELGGDGVPLLVLLRVLRGNPFRGNRSINHATFLAANAGGETRGAYLEGRLGGGGRGNRWRPIPAPLVEEERGLVAVRRRGEGFKEQRGARRCFV